MDRTVDRRTFLARAGALAGLAAAPAILPAQQLFAAYPFRLGIAAGDPAPDGFVIWTRLAPEPLEPHGGMPMAPVEVDWTVATDDRMRNVVQRGKAIARPELAHSVHVELAGLEPGRPYWYRFAIGGERSLTGRAKTAPAIGAPLAELRFGVAGCQAYEDGLYTAFRHLAAEDVDFVFHYGDYIYEGRGQPIYFGYDGSQWPRVRLHAGQTLYSLDDYRRRYAQYKLDDDLQLAHTRAAWFTTFDDHEIRNDWTGLDDTQGTPPQDFALRRAAAFQAYYEHMPLRTRSFPAGGGMQIYRRQRYGDLLDAHFLDTRQFRTPQPCGGGFATACPETARADAQVMGRTQEAWLAAALQEKAARWNLIGQQVMMMPLDRRTGSEALPILNTDSWAGYDAPRERTLAAFRGLGNVVVLTGDEHQNFAGDLRTEGGRGDIVASEFVTTSISSGGSGSDKRAGEDRIRAANPFLHWTNDWRGYGVCTLTRDTWAMAYRTVDQVATAGAPVRTRAVATVEHGRPGFTLRTDDRRRG